MSNLAELRAELDEWSSKFLRLENKHRLTLQELRNMSSAQGNLYRFQEKIEQQKTIYAQIAEVGHKFNESMDFPEVLNAVSRFCIDLLNFERFALILPTSKIGEMEVKLCGGFHALQGHPVVENLKIAHDHPALRPFVLGKDKWLATAEEGEFWHKTFFVDDFCIYSIGVSEGLLKGLLLVGGTRANRTFHRGVGNDEELDALFSNITSLIAGAQTTVKFTQAIQYESAQVHRLLDNMKQAVFSVDARAIVTEPVSRFSSDIFGGQLVGQSVHSTVFKDIPEGSESRAKMETVFATCFGEDDLQWMLASDQFPARFHYQKDGDVRTLKLNVQPIFDEQSLLEKLMFVIEDVTEIEKLETQIQRERFEIDIIQQILRNDIGNVKDFFVKSTELLMLVLRILSQPSVSAEDFGVLMRTLHTLKGNSRLFGFAHISKSVHEAESKMLELKSALVAGNAMRLVPLRLLADVSLGLAEYIKVSKKVFKIEAGFGNFAVCFQRSLVDSNFGPDKEYVRLCLELMTLNGAQQWVYDLLKQWENPELLGENEVKQALLQVRAACTKGELAEKTLDARYKTIEVVDVNLRRLQTTIEALAGPRSERAIGDLRMAFRRLTEVPLLPFLENFKAMVNEVSTALGKSAQLAITGDDVSVPRETLGAIQDIIVQILRNAIDHGLEAPVDRVGKSELGNLRIEVRETETHMHLNVSDDGRGIDPAQLVKSAIKKGILIPGQNLSLSQQIELIFLPGFSSKEQASDLSGRGVGMDIVKSAVDRFNGKIEVVTEIKKGTEFRISIPLEQIVHATSRET